MRIYAVLWVKVRKRWAFPIFMSALKFQFPSREDGTPISHLERREIMSPPAHPTCPIEVLMIDSALRVVHLELLPVAVSLCHSKRCYLPVIRALGTHRTHFLMGFSLQIPQGIQSVHYHSLTDGTTLPLFKFSSTATVKV